MRLTCRPPQGYHYLKPYTCSLALYLNPKLSSSHSFSSCEAPRYTIGHHGHSFFSFVMVLLSRSHQCREADRSGHHISLPRVFSCFGALYLIAKGFLCMLWSSGGGYLWYYLSWEQEHPWDQDPCLYMLRFFHLLENPWMRPGTRRKMRLGYGTSIC